MLRFHQRRSNSILIKIIATVLWFVAVFLYGAPWVAADDDVDQPTPAQEYEDAYADRCQILRDQTEALTDQKLIRFNATEAGRRAKQLLLRTFDFADLDFHDVSAEATLREMPEILDYFRYCPTGKLLDQFEGPTIFMTDLDSAYHYLQALYGLEVDGLNNLEEARQLERTLQAVPPILLPSHPFSPLRDRHLTLTVQEETNILGIPFNDGGTYIPGPIFNGIRLPREELGNNYTINHELGHVIDFETSLAISGHAAFSLSKSFPLTLYPHKHYRWVLNKHPEVEDGTKAVKDPGTDKDVQTVRRRVYVPSSSRSVVSVYAAYHGKLDDVAEMVEVYASFDHKWMRCLLPEKFPVIREQVYQGIDYFSYLAADQCSSAEALNYIKKRGEEIEDFYLARSINNGWERHDPDEFDLFAMSLISQMQRPNGTPVTLKLSGPLTRVSDEPVYTNLLFDIVFNRVQLSRKRGLFAEKSGRWAVLRESQQLIILFTYDGEPYKMEGHLSMLNSGNNHVDIKVKDGVIWRVPKPLSGEQPQRVGTFWLDN